VLDSLTVAGGLGALAIRAAQLANDGATAAEAAAALGALIPRHQIAILLGTLEYLQRGGRIGRARALLAGMLNVKPIVRLQDGEVGAGERVRSRRRGIDLVLGGVTRLPEVEKVIVEHTGCEPEATALAAQVTTALPKASVEVRWIGPVVGAYVGPGGVGLVAVQKPLP
jgi:DegV family protein with EDD domain